MCRDIYGKEKLASASLILIRAMKRVWLWVSHSSERNSFVSKHVLSLFLFLSGVSPFAVSPGDARLAELQRYVQREADALAVASDVAKQLEGIASLDCKAAAEVELDRGGLDFTPAPEPQL